MKPVPPKKKGNWIVIMHGDHQGVVTEVIACKTKASKAEVVINGAKIAFNFSNICRLTKPTVVRLVYTLTSSHMLVFSYGYFCCYSCHEKYMYVIVIHIHITKNKFILAVGSIGSSVGSVGAAVGSAVGRTLHSPTYS